MVTIKSKDEKEIFQVTQGAYNTVFEGQGYSIVPKPKKAGQHKSADKASSEDERFVAELMEKPISQWTKDEVKRFVDIKGIDTTGAKSVNEVKDLIKSMFQQ